VRDWLVGFGFPRHHYAEAEAFYKPQDYPLGPSFWVRKIVFQKVPFFDETIGARPRNRIMGEEASFLLNLQEHGFQILYYPQAVVYHRSLPEAFTLPWLRHRAYTWGRGRTRLYGWHRLDLYHKSKVLWCMVLVVEEFHNVLRFLAGFFLAKSTRNCDRVVSAMIMLGQLHETANQVFKRFKPMSERKLKSR
jgi:GT2 family glycosyltransferase